jgi:predicted transcriptional regulator
MGSFFIQELTETENEVIRLLVEVGLKMNEARILVVFFRGPDLTSRELERIADLRQPEVSVAITSLTKKKWIIVSSLITENKGRPVKVFALSEPVDAILDELRDGICEGHDQQMLMLSRIREIIRK